jgi:hypothetical protein
MTYGRGMADLLTGPSRRFHLPMSLPVIQSFETCEPEAGVLGITVVCPCDSLSGPA